ACNSHAITYIPSLCHSQVLMQLSSSQPCCSFNSFCSREQNPCCDRVVQQLSASPMFLALKGRRTGVILLFVGGILSVEIQIVKYLQNIGLLLHNNVYTWNNWRTKRHNCY
ncbi:hypothetical protein ABKV19_002504, partial [Rosa sericea]